MAPAMDLQSYLRPLYQDLDGVTRFDAVERVARIARRLYTPASEDDARPFELLLLFHGLGKWLDKMGSLSRTALAVDGLSEAELRQTAASIARLDAPASDAERAVAAALLIDHAGVRGLAERLARSRREGQSVADVVRAALADDERPEWLSAEAAAWLEERRVTRREFCRAILEEAQ
ncbi:MAG: hypothetical protein AABO58_05050 [Acidobacteriota bacterium]